VRLRAGYRLAVAGVRRAAAVITVSQTSRSDVEAHLRLGRVPVRSVYNGLESFWFDPSPERDASARIAGTDGDYLLYAGSYEPRKNLLGAVEAYRLASQRTALPPLVLVVEKESGHKEAVMQRVAASGMSRSLRFVHSLSDSELHALYAGARIFLYPSYYEGFGFPPLQALACGVPVAASRTGSLPEVLGGAAVYFDPRDPAEIAEALLQVWNNPELQRNLSATGPGQAAGFRWTRTAKETVEIYRLGLRSSEARGCHRWPAIS
jgi:glycosyltransferase involved in cell wall biosynthesis